MLEGKFKKLNIKINIDLICQPVPVEELLWLEEFAGLDEAREKLLARFDFYNNCYLHSALVYRSPLAYERLYQAENLGKAT